MVTRTSSFVGVTYWSDASIFFDKGRIETCLYGPGDINLVDSSLEYVPVVQVERSAGLCPNGCLILRNQIGLMRFKEDRTNDS